MVLSHTHRERERERDFINNCYTFLQFAIFYNICFWKKKYQTWTYIIYILHDVTLFFFSFYLLFNLIILSKKNLLSCATHWHNTSIYIYKKRPHAEMHEVLPCGTLILHLAFFYLFSLSFFFIFLLLPNKS